LLYRDSFVIDAITRYARVFTATYWMSTRNATYLFGIGPAITESDKIITGAKLPTDKQILRCFLYYKQNSEDQKVL